jgi:hypothetical protein
MSSQDEENKGTVPYDAKDGGLGHEHESSDGFETESHNSETQAGVKKVEAISAMWTTAGLAIAYCT